MYQIIYQSINYIKLKISENESQKLSSFSNLESKNIEEIFLSKLNSQKFGR